MRGSVCGEVVEVYSFVGAAACEDYLLGLFWDGCGRWRESEAADGGCVGIEEECICELDIFVGRYDCCDSVEDSVVGPRYYLDCNG